MRLIELNRHQLNLKYGSMERMCVSTKKQQNLLNFPNLISFIFQMHVGYLKHVIEIFERVGYQWVNGSIDPDWDVCVQKSFDDLRTNY